MTLSETKENKAMSEALKNVLQTQWTGTTVHNNMDKCLTAINLDSNNSGHYNPVAIRVNGLIGWFMINQDGSLFCEARVIKESYTQFKIEYMTNQAWNKFDDDYCKILDEN